METQTSLSVCDNVRVRSWVLSNVVFFKMWSLRLYIDLHKNACMQLNWGIRQICYEFRITLHPNVCCKWMLTNVNRVMLFISRRPKRWYVADSEWQRTRRQKQRTGPLKIENPCLLTYQCRCDHTYIHEDVPIHWVVNAVDHKRSTL